MPADSDSPFGPGVTLPSKTDEVDLTSTGTELAVIAPEDPFLKSLSPTIRKNLNQKQLQGLISYSKGIRFGFTSQASPMICKDEKCAFHDKCPLVQHKIPRPFGTDCPVEKAQIASWTDTFTTAAGIDVHDPSSAYDMLIVDQIVFQMTLEARAAWHLAIDPKIERKYISGYNPMGQPFYTTEVSKAAEYYEKLTKTKLKLMKELLATRKAKADAEAKGYADPSRVAANLMEKANKLRAVTQKADGSTEAFEIEMKPVNRRKEKESVAPVIPEDLKHVGNYASE